MAIPANTQREIDDLWQVFSEFRTIRRDEHAQIAARNFPPAIPKQILASSQDSFSIESPKIEKALKEHVKITTDNDIEIEVIPLESGDPAKRISETIRLWFETHFHTPEFNHNKRLEKAGAEGQIGPNGVSILRLHATLPKEGAFEVPEGEGYEDARLEYYRGQKVWRVSIEDPMTCAWGPELGDADFERFVQKGVITWAALGTLRGETGESAQNLFDLEKMGYVGPPMDEQKSEAWKASKTFDFIRYEYLDKDTTAKQGYPCWRFREFVQVEGKPDTAAELNDAKLPFRHSSYFIVEGGDVTESELVDPEKRYRSMLYPLIVLVHEKNMWDTVLAAMSYQALVDDRIVVEVGQMTEQGQQLFAQLGGEIGGVMYEGEGATRQATIRLPRKNANDEINAVPGKLSRWPTATEVIPAMIQRINDLKEEISLEETNARLLGRSYVQNQEETGAVGSLEFQAASTPYGPHNRSRASIYEKIFRAMLDCVNTWDVGSERFKPYPVTTTGQGRKDNPGQSITLTAEQARARVIIQVKIRTESQQEKQLRHADAWARFDRGAILWEELLTELGIDDPHDYAMKLYEEGELIKMEQLAGSALAMIDMQELQIATGIDLVAAGQAAAVLTGGVMAGEQPLPPRLLPRVAPQPPPYPKCHFPIVGPELPQPYRGLAAMGAAFDDPTAH